MPENVVFILGAGASKPYGLPTAAKLKEMILAEGELPFGRRVPADEARLAFELVEDLKAQFAASGLESIDRFLELNPGREHYGKRLIANALLQKEINAVCQASIASDWYAWYFRHIHLPKSRSIYTTNQTIITFNYDNTLEWALRVMVQGAFGLDAESALSRFKALPIVHVYGRLEMYYEIGKWFPRAAGDFTHAVNASGDGIHIVSRGQMGESKDLQAARDAIQKATKIVFLGFGFDEVNLERLGLGVTSGQYGPLRNASVYACAFGLRGRERDRVRGYLTNLERDKILPSLSLGDPDQGCEEFLRENVDLRSWLDITEQ